MSVSEDALVAVCLCTRLGRGERVLPLDAAAWTGLVLTLHRDSGATPRDLLEKDAQQLRAAFALEPDFATRIEGMMRGLASVGMEIGRLESTGIWVLTRGDEDYPRIWKRRLGASAPPVLFGAGPRAALAADLVAIVGSRHADAAGHLFARQLAELCARDGWGVVSGGARSVEQVAMDAALSEGGFGAEILADSLERAVSKRAVREAILGERLTVLTTDLPGGSHTPAKGAERNRLVYALARFACVVSTDAGRGDTWTSATDAIRRQLARVFVRMSDDAPAGNRALMGEGALPTRVPLADSVEQVFAAANQPPSDRP